MIPELGHYALVLALALGLIQSVVPVVGARRHDDALMRLAILHRRHAIRFRRAVVRGADDLLYHLGFLGRAPCSRIPIRMMPLVYKFTSVWGNHEGSMLLWVLILSLFGAAVAFVRHEFTDHLEGECAGGAVVDRFAPSIFSFCSLRIRSCACRRRRSRAAISIRFCRIPASPFIRRCFISAMSASRSPFPSPSQH